MKILIIGVLLALVNPVLSLCTIDDVDTGSDTATCSGEESCQGKTIVGCKRVVCSGVGSCRAATVDSTGVPDATLECTGGTACSGRGAGSFVGFKEVICQNDGTGRFRCGGTTFDSTGVEGATMKCSLAAGGESSRECVGPMKAIGFSSITCDGGGSCTGTTSTGGRVECNDGDQACWRLQGQPDSVFCKTSTSCWDMNVPYSGLVTDGYSPAGNYVIEPPTLSSMAGGDPHFMTWNGDWFDFHGQCDLVLLHNPNFRGGLGLSIHVRTKIRYGYSYIESVAISIGQQDDDAAAHDVLEVSSFGEYSVNGVTGATLPFMMADRFLVAHDQLNKKRNWFYIELGNDAEQEQQQQQIAITTFKEMVTVKIVNATMLDFEDSVGLMGKFDSTMMLGRDGKTVFTASTAQDSAAAVAFGQEWQVLDNEPKLFSYQENFPQHPHPCVLPDDDIFKTTTKDGTSPSRQRRRLGEKSIDKAAAEEACAHLSSSDQMRQFCIYDVMATGDLDVAQTFGDA